jgi:hypothetical protein
MPGHRLPGMRGIPLRGDVADYPPYLELIPGLRLICRSGAAACLRHPRVRVSQDAGMATERGIPAAPAPRSRPHCSTSRPGSAARRL